MKLISNILMLILVWFICGARSCSSDHNMEEQHMQKVLEASKDSIKQVFAVNYPSDQQLHALEATAVRKLNDFNDLLNIVSDTSIDIKFRQKAADMAGKLFISADIDTRKWSKVYSGTDINMINQLITNSLLKGLTYKVTPSQITVSKKLIRENDSVYKGALSFHQECIPFNNSNQSVRDLSLCTINIYAVKKVKSFGKEQFKLWDVYLGDIY